MGNSNSVWLSTSFTISSFVFNRTKKLIQIWNSLRVSKWQNFHFWVNYPFKVKTYDGCSVSFWFDIIHNSVRFQHCTWVVLRKGRWAAVYCEVHGTPQKSFGLKLTPVDHPAPLSQHKTAWREKYINTEMHINGFGLKCTFNAADLHSLCLEYRFWCVCKQTGCE